MITVFEIALLFWSGAVIYSIYDIYFNKRRYPLAVESRQEEHKIEVFSSTHHQLSPVFRPSHAQSYQPSQMPVNYPSPFAAPENLPNQDHIVDANKMVTPARKMI